MSWKCWHMSTYQGMYSTLVHVYSRSDRSKVCRLACNVRGGITVAVFSRRRFFDLRFVRISPDWQGFLAVLSPLGNYHRLDFSVLRGSYTCVLATLAPYLQHHTIISADQEYLLVLFRHLLARSLLEHRETQPLPITSMVSNIHDRL